jgi:hypothetical protein
MRFVRVRVLVLFMISLLILGGTICITQISVSLSAAYNCDEDLLLSEPNNEIHSETRNNARTWTDWSLTTDTDFSNGSLTKLSIEGVGTGGQLVLEKEGQWLQMKPSTKPSPRIKQGMATVFNDDKIMLFGGTDGLGSGENNETWQYDFSDNQWYLKSPSTKPPARYGLSMSAINNSDELIIYGGETAKSPSNLYYKDTWKYNVSSNQWTNMTPSINGTPNTEYGHAMAMVHNTDKIVLFGGFYTYGSFGGDETWVYDLSENKWEQKFPVVKPPIRSLAGMSPIYNKDLVLLFGGYDGQSGYRKDTWIYNLTANTWTNKNPGYGPDTVNRHALSPIHDDDKVVLFGGSEVTWVYDLSENVWTHVYPSKNPPFVGVMANLHGTVKGIHFGGFGASTGDETWSYDINMYESTGDFMPFPHYCSGNSMFKTIDWSATTLPGTKIEFQFRTGQTKNDLNSRSFVGPDGTANTYYTTSGTELWSGHQGDSWCQYKAYFNTTDYYVTPILHDTKISYNVIPELKNSNVAPAKGDITDKFNFSIMYSDLDGDPPEYVKLWIEGTNYTMIENNQIIGDYIEGKIFWYKLKLPSGDHLYKFFASDGDISVFTFPLPLKVDIGPLDHIVVTPKEASITTDDYIQFSAVGYDQDENIVKFTPKWEVNGGGSIDSTGNFTAAIVGTWKVYVSSNGVSGNATVTVSHGIIKKIVVSPDESRITTDDYQIFTAQGFDNDNNLLDLEFAWEVTGGGVIDQSGNYTAQQPGIWTIYANSSGLSGNAIIEVNLGELAKIIVTPVDSEIRTDQSIEFTATSYDSDMNVLSISPVWDSSGVSTITKDGNFTSRFIGEFKVFANFSGISGNATVSVIPGLVKTISLSPLFEETNVSESVEFTAEFYDAFDNEVEISSPTWDVSGGGAIDQSGKFIAENPGYWTVYCNISDISEEAQVKVNSMKDVDDKDDKDDTKTDDDSEYQGFTLYAGIIFVIIITVVIVIIVLLLVVKKKPKEDQGPEQPLATQIPEERQTLDPMPEAKYEAGPESEPVAEQRTCPNCNSPMFHNPEANYFECSMCNSVVLDQDKNIMDEE